MILPSKHIRFAESLMGLGAIIVDYLGNDSKTIDDIWKKISKLNNSKKLPAYHSFDNLVLSLNYLFLIGAIDVDYKDRLYVIKKEKEIQ